MALYGLSVELSILLLGPHRGNGTNDLCYCLIVVVFSFMFDFIVE